MMIVSSVSASRYQRDREQQCTRYHPDDLGIIQLTEKVQALGMRVSSFVDGESTAEMASQLYKATTMIIG